MSALTRVIGKRWVERRKTSLEISFLPAALEIVERPPSPIGRAISISVMVLFVLALAWSCLARVDLVAVAQGTIVPSGRSKVVQPLETGVVKDILVQDGQRVAAGQLLIRLDQTTAGADRDRMKSDRVMAKLDVARLTAILRGSQDLDPPSEATPEQVAQQREYLASRQAEQAARVASLERQKTQKGAEASVIDQTSAKTQAVIAPLQERVNVRKYLSERQEGSKLTYLQELQDLVSQQQELLVLRKKRAETDAAIAALDQDLTQAKAEYRSHAYADLTAAQQKVAELDQELKKGNEKARLLDLRAPVDGVVEQLSVHTVGGIVRPAENLMVVVPRNSRLEIEAMLPNREIGFVRAGQRAAVKIDTFNFTQYGLLQGKVTSVSAQSIERETGDRSKSSAGLIGETSEPRGRELNYSVRIALDSAVMKTEVGDVPLTAGMATTVEIKTGSRRVISYLLSPIKKRAQESLHER